MESPSSDGEGYILLIEDDLNVLEIIQWVLAGEGWETVGATDGRTGLDQALEQKPSLVILDLNLPVLSGDVVADELRRRYEDIPILLITGDKYVDFHAFRARAFGYLQKPFDLNALVGAVSIGLLQGRNTKFHRFPDLS